MRQSRRLALMLAAQFIPFAAYAQTAQRTAPANANTNQDDEESDEEEESSSSTPASDAAAAPQPAAAEPEESDADRRTRMLARYSTLDGSIGLLHTATGQLGAAGSFRFGLTGEFASASGFLRPADLAGTAFVGGEDDARHVGGTFTLSYSPLDFLEVFGSVRAYAMVRATEARASLNLLWALEGALTGLPWQVVAKEHRLSLLFALEAQNGDA